MGLGCVRGCPTQLINKATEAVAVAGVERYPPNV